jgi:hypothetical protein
MVKFLKDLSSGANPALETQFRKDPVGAMTAHGVSKDMQSLILKGDSKAITAKLKGVGGINPAAADADTTVVVVVL